jgi:hypothetical protein
MIDVDDALVTMVLQKQHEASQRGKLSIWTIYNRPRDWPDGYIARQFQNDKPTAIVLCGDADSLEIMREVFARAGLVCMMRADSDDRVIVETWM